MFMCDKAPVQRELAENLGGLVNLFKDDRFEGVRFFRSFCITMQRYVRDYSFVVLHFSDEVIFFSLPSQRMVGSTHINCRFHRPSSTVSVFSLLVFLRVPTICERLVTEVPNHVKVLC